MVFGTYTKVVFGTYTDEDWEREHNDLINPRPEEQDWTKAINAYTITRCDGSETAIRVMDCDKSTTQSFNLAASVLVQIEIANALNALVSELADVSHRLIDLESIKGHLWHTNEHLKEIARMTGKSYQD